MRLEHTRSVSHCVLAHEASYQKLLSFLDEYQPTVEHGGGDHQAHRRVVADHAHLIPLGGITVQALQLHVVAG